MSKGYDGYLYARPGNGWGSTTSREGFFLYADSIDLGPNKEFKDRPEKIVQGRSLGPTTRSGGAQKPGGSFEYQPRSQDFPMLAMAHFQMYIGTTPGAGTQKYTFVPVQNEPDWSGATYGTGGYSTDAGDMFVVDVWKKFHETGSGTNNTEKYSSCIVDELTLTAASNEDVKVSCGIKADGFTLAREASTTNPLLLVHTQQIVLSSIL